MSVCLKKSLDIKTHLKTLHFPGLTSAFSFSVCVYLFSAQSVPVEALSSFLCGPTNVYTNLIFLPLFAAVHAIDCIQKVLVTITFFSWDSLISAANGLICFLRASHHELMPAAAYYLITVWQTLCVLH